MRGSFEAEIFALINYSNHFLFVLATWRRVLFRLIPFLYYIRNTQRRLCGLYMRSIAPYSLYLTQTHSVCQHFCTRLDNFIHLIRYTADVGKYKRVEVKK